MNTKTYERWELNINSYYNTRVLFNLSNIIIDFIKIFTIVGTHKSQSEGSLDQKLYCKNIIKLIIIITTVTIIIK